MVAVGGAATAQETVRVGIAAEPYPPFTVPDASGNWTGWEIDIMNALCDEAGLECIVTPTAWDGIIPALTSGRIDMIVGSMSITEERLRTIDFSDKYYNTPTIIVGTKDLEFDATPEGLAGKVLGVQVATVHQVYASKYFTDADIRQYQTQDEANQDLVAGRIDATQADALALEAFLESPDGSACCEVKGTVADDPEILGAGVGVGLRKGDDELREKINAAIAAIRENGTYEATSANYFDFDVYGD
jgi:polar amino acid transport system substrate-binding protein